MAGPRAARLQVGSAPWIAEERSSAQQIAHDEIEEFSFSARNDFEWLNEHMADVFSENQINVAEIFKTPGKLRGKTPRTVRKAHAVENRVPLSDIFSATPKGAANPFAIPNIDRNQTARVKIAADPQPQRSSARINRPPSPEKNTNVVSVVDSGYHGSQSQDAMDVDDYEPTPQKAKASHVAFHVASPEREAHENPDPTATLGEDMSTQYFTANVAKYVSSPNKTVHHESTTPAGSPIPQMESPKKTSPIKSSPVKSTAKVETQVLRPNAAAEDTRPDESSRSPSDGSSPVRPKVHNRTSSLSFAPLPAREPITHKSIGNRVSRTSHLDPKRTSYYNRTTGGKSLGNARHEATDDENDDMDIDEDEDDETIGKHAEQDDTAAHNKTYTQRLQDQISRLGQSQPNAPRPSKSIANAPLTTATAPSSQLPPTPKRKASPKMHSTPGAFPEDDDDDDDWIQPLGPPDNASSMFSPRPGMPKSYSTDVMEGVSGKITVSDGDFAVPKTRQQDGRSKSPEKTTSTTNHHKSASVPSLPSLGQLNGDGGPLKKTMTISVSNPGLAAVSENEAGFAGTPTKSPSRTLRESPLKQVKSKLSSILKSSKGLLASSAAISAEGKSSLLSPSTPRLGLHAGPSTPRLGLHAGHSTMTLNQQPGEEPQPLYPDLSRHAVDAQTLSSSGSPTRTEGRRTRASIEREKAEEKRKEKEAREARRMAEQMQKLEQAREKEREKARVFSEEQKRIAAMEKQIASQKEQEKKALSNVQTPGNPSKPTRTSPRKTKAQLEAEARAAAESKVDDDAEMVDAPGTMPPPSAPRSAAPASTTKIKRPMKPTKELAGKTKPNPAVIRIDMNARYHPSNSALASSLHDTLGPSGSQSQLKSKASQATLQTKPSLQSLKSSASSSGRPKALDIAARKREQEERDQQRKREAKAEMERKRDEEKQQRRLEAEKQKEEERKQAAAQAEAKKNAQRQAMLEKAKQTKAPPPAARSQNGQPEYKNAPQSDSQPPRPPSRMIPAAQRSREDLGRPVGTALPNGAKSATKRTLQQDAKGAKKMRMSDDDLDDDVEMESQPSLKGAPLRPSIALKKVTAGTMLPPGPKATKTQQDLPSKSMFPIGYTPAPPSATRDLFKTTVTNQHNSQVKAGHPLDISQLSKGNIPGIAPPGSSHKTPGRPVGVAGTKSAAKSATRTSPRFQNGETIELPEINTDDEDEDDYEDQKQFYADWTDSPALKRQLAAQENQDPMEIFGVPGPLNMEEVFSKSKDRWHKFRARTSSANWSGADRLTEDDIRKDLAAREKLRREGAWTYEMGKELL